jgi:hypothetical protein
MQWRSEDAAVAADAVVVAVDVPRDIDRRRLHAAAATDRLCRGHRANLVVQARQVRIALVGRVARRARARQIDLLRE